MRNFGQGLICMVALAGAVGIVHVARAVTVDFENPPYVAGSVVGQDGWALTSYFPTPNGTVVVSATNPLVGGQSQSLSYTRVDTTLAPNGSDVVKADVVRIAKDGTPAADLSASFLISSTSLSGQGLGFGIAGLFLSPAGASGATPIGIRLNNAGSTIPSIEEFAEFLGGSAFHYFGGSLAAAAFPENDTLEFDIDVDFDSSTYTTSYRNVTTGGPFISSGFTRGFAVPYPANGDGTYDVDVVAAFRYGAGRIDNITLTGNVVPEPTAVGLAILGVAAVGPCQRKRR